ncbi:facilitated trehalose transporter Tret1-like isoform X2 [Portunus trituberculatus]|nr:facilitated trehalose transporter Tret1-like isoform X2 [Portunus trituberculatus]
MTFTLLPIAATWLMQGLSPSLTMLYVGRILGSLGFMIFSTLVNPLMAELLEPKYRGFLGCLSEIVVSIGMLLAYLMAELFTWRLVTILSAVPFIPIFFLSLGVPESPYWLVRAGRMKEAEEALITVRGPLRRLSAQEELLQIQKSIKEQPQARLSQQVWHISKPQNFRPLLLMTAIIVLRELGGQFAIFSYAVYFFRNAGVQMKASTCTVLLGVARLFSTVACSSLLDRVGRRFILTVGSSCCAVSTAIGSIFLLWDIPGSSWVPVMAVICFVLGYGFGVGPIPWVLLGELLPTPIRVVGACICTCLYATMEVIVGLCFPQMMDEVGLGGSLLIFAAFNLLLMVVVRRFLPETANSSLHLLEYVFKKNYSTDEDRMSPHEPLLH